MTLAAASAGDRGWWLAELPKKLRTERQLMNAAGLRDNCGVSPRDRRAACCRYVTAATRSRPCSRTSTGPRAPALEYATASTTERASEQVADRELRRHLLGPAQWRADHPPVAQNDCAE
jgi:hypothetical protein